MNEAERRRDLEERLRRVAITAASGQPPEALDPREHSASEEPEKSDEEQARDRRMEHHALWVDMKVRAAMERGEFDNLSGAGKPIPGLGETHDPDWWVKKLIEREQITGVLPPALALRKEDAALEERLDREATEDGVRRVVADFNHRVVEARRQLLGGPPVVTATRDADAEVAAWRVRRTERRERARRKLEESRTATETQERRGWRPRWWPGHGRRRGSA